MTPLRSLLRFVVYLVWLAPTLAHSEGLRMESVVDGVYALVGPKVQRDRENLANNATFGVVVTGDGVVLVDPGGSRKGAARIDAAVRRLTDQPVRVIINTGGQDHRWLGNGYWKARGARIIASRAAVADQTARASAQLAALESLLGEELAGTEPVHADEVFESTHAFTLGGVLFELTHPGPAHTPGDAYVWLPEQRVMFAGDIVYTERVLGIGGQSHSGHWVEAFRAMAAHNPEWVVPGHGAPARLSRARADTFDYLTHLRARIREHLDAGGDVIGATEVDQSAFARLEQFDALARRNAQAVFIEMEFE